MGSPSHTYPAPSFARLPPLSSNTPLFLTLAFGLIPVSTLSSRSSLCTAARGVGGSWRNLYELLEFISCVLHHGLPHRLLLGLISMCSLLFPITQLPHNLPVTPLFLMSFSVPSRPSRLQPSIPSWEPTQRSLAQGHECASLTFFSSVVIFMCI